MIYYSIHGTLWYDWRPGKIPQYYVTKLRRIRCIEQVPGLLYNSDLDNYQFKIRVKAKEFIPITLSAVINKHNNAPIHPDTLRILLKELAQ